MEEKTMEQRIGALSLLEKCALLSGAETFKTRGMAGRGIPSIRLSDGPHGVRKQAGESDHLGLNPSEPATCFPTAATVANSWDPALGRQIGEALGREAAAQGVSVLLGPGLNIKRSPLCGRNFEYFSEDPYLAGKMAAGYIRGIQQNGVAACPKHFAVNSQETRRMASDSVVDERTLREIYLTGFEIAVREGNPKTIMSAYNLINGTYANESEHLLCDILKKSWGFSGAVVTDWGGSNDHALGVRYGSTLEMPAPGGDSVRELMRAVETGKIQESDVDARLAELLTLIDSTQPAVTDAPPFDREAHHALARRAAGESLVLLKNEGDLLPLAAGAKVAVIGDFARTPRYQGAGSSVVNCTKLDTLLDLMPQSGLTMVGYAQGFARHGGADQALQAEATALAARAEVVLLCLGLDEIQESEGLDRTSMRLAQNQIDLLAAVAKANPRVAVLFSAGSAVETPWLDDCQALLYAALGGQAGAGAVLDAVTGRLTPGGKLTETWPLRAKDTPSLANFAGNGKTVEYREGLYVGYRYFTTANRAVRFPFGFGLSYTSFAYRDLVAGEAGVSLTVTNTGRRPGSEIVQLYVSGPAESAIFRPVRELKGFAKVSLAPGESRTVQIALDDKAFRYWNVKTDRWEVEPGSYTLLAGASVADIRLETAWTVTGAAAPDPYAGLALREYRSGQVASVPDDAFAALLGRPIPDSRVHGKLDRNVTFSQMIHGKSPIGWLVWCVLTLLLKLSEARGKPNLNALFIYNMPLRALAKMTGGGFSMEMVDGVVAELNGWWIIGLVRVLIGLVKNSAANAALERQLTAANTASAGEGAAQ